MIVLCLLLHSRASSRSTSFSYSYTRDIGLIHTNSFQLPAAVGAIDPSMKVMHLSEYGLIGNLINDGNAMLWLRLSAKAFCVTLKINSCIHYQIHHIETQTLTFASSIFDAKLSQNTEHVPLYDCVCSLRGNLVLAS